MLFFELGTGVAWRVTTAKHFVVQIAHPRIHQEVMKLTLVPQFKLGKLTNHVSCKYVLVVTKASLHMQLVRAAPFTSPLADRVLLFFLRHAAAVIAAYCRRRWMNALISAHVTGWYCCLWHCEKIQARRVRSDEGR